MELHNASNNESNDGILGSELWEWQNEDYYLPKDPTNDFSSLLWDELNQDDNNLMNLFGDQTPIKDCMDFGYNNTNNNNINNSNNNINLFCLEDYASKEIQEEPSSLIKRRKMLQFNSDSNGKDTEICAVTSSTVTSMSSTSSNGISENLRLSSNSISNYPDASNVLRKSNSSEWWNGNYAPEKLAYYSSDETSCSKNSIGSPLDHVNISGFGERTAEVESEVVQETAKLSTLKIFKGKKSVIKAPKKVTSLVANPFTLIKPFGVQEGVTLEDINAKIHKPPPMKKKIQQIGNFKYQISEFSGKPVVGKKKICTEGGKGSITILRTKG